MIPSWRILNGRLDRSTLQREGDSQILACVTVHFSLTIQVEYRIRWEPSLKKLKTDGNGPSLLKFVCTEYYAKYLYKYNEPEGMDATMAAI